MYVGGCHLTQEGRAPVTVSNMTSEFMVMTPHRLSPKGDQGQSSHSLSFFLEAIARKFSATETNVTALSTNAYRGC